VTAMAATREAPPCPDDPIADIHALAMQEVRAIAAAAIADHAGNRQLVHLAAKIRAAEHVTDARLLVAKALLKSKTNRPLQDLALDIVNRLKGL
jgi:hypothetical protein